MQMTNVKKIQEFSDKLPEGATLFNGEYTIRRFLNDGGFGLTYLASDGLNRNVVIKECFPKAICRRSQLVVGIRSKAQMTEFANMVEFFIKEAVKLSKLKHPNIVHVHHVFEENATAYMAMDHVTGFDMLTLLENTDYKFEPNRIIDITLKILDAMSYIHAMDMLHRDISPDNILIDDRGQPKIIDFGASKEEVSKASRALSAQLQVVKEGYSPQEFYIEGSEQTPASDLYGIAASIYQCITGEVPPNSNLRLSEVAQGNPDLYRPVAGRYKGYPQNFLEAIDKNMELFPQSRSQSAEDWLAMLDTSFVNDMAPLPAKSNKRHMKFSFTVRPVFAAIGLSVLVSGAVTYAYLSKNSIPEAAQTVISVQEPTVSKETVPDKAPQTIVIEAKKMTDGEALPEKKSIVPSGSAENTIENKSSEPVMSIADIMSELALETSSNEAATEDANADPSDTSNPETLFQPAN